MTKNKKAFQLSEVYSYREHLIDVMKSDGAITTITVKANDKTLGKAIAETMESLFQYETEMPQVVAIM